MLTIGAILFLTAAATFLWMRFADRDSEGYERNNRTVMITLSAINAAAAVVILTNFV